MFGVSKRRTIPINVANIFGFSGLLPSAKVASTMWADVNAFQKRIVADAMYAERCGRPLISDAPCTEDQMDSMLVATVRLASTARSFVVAHISGEAFAADEVGNAHALFVGCVSSSHNTSLFFFSNCLRHAIC